MPMIIERTGDFIPSARPGGQSFIRVAFGDAAVIIGLGDIACDQFSRGDRVRIRQTDTGEVVAVRRVAAGAVEEISLEDFLNTGDFLIEVVTRSSETEI